MACRVERTAERGRPAQAGRFAIRGRPAARTCIPGRGGVCVLITLIAAAVFACDVVTKYLVASHMRPGDTVAVIPHFFSITYIHNAGAAFGLLQNQTLLFLVITAAVIALILTYGRRVARSTPILGVAFGLQLGGALGNLLDRLLYARVIDFIDFKVWPFIFNVADMAIVIGGALFALVVLREPAAEEGRRP